MLFRSHTAEALPLVIPKLKALGYEFVTVSELLAAGKPVISETCYDSRPGDTDRYDNLLALRAKPRLLPWQSTLEVTTAPPPPPQTKANREPSHGNNWTVWPF